MVLDNFYDLLRSENIIDISEPTWKRISVFHGQDCLDFYQASQWSHLRNVFNGTKGVAGVYAYRVGVTWIYIGVSKNIRERAYQHLLESAKQWGHPAYIDTFSKYCGLIDLFYLPIGNNNVEGNFLRSIVEKVLQVYHKPVMMSKKI